MVLQVQGRNCKSTKMSVVKYNEFSKEICVKTIEKEEINSKQQRG